MTRVGHLYLLPLSVLVAAAGCASPPSRVVDDTPVAPNPAPHHEIAPVVFEDAEPAHPAPSDRVRAAAPMAIEDTSFRSATADQPNRLDAIEALAMAAHPAIASQQARVQAARGNWLQAGLPPNPAAQYQGEEIGKEDAAGLHSLQVSQTWVTANKLELARNVAAAEIAQAQADLATTELQVRTAVRIAFIAALIAQQRVERTEQLGEIAEQSVESVQQMFTAAEVSRIAVLQAETEADNARIAVDNASANLQAARQALAAAAGTSELPAGPLVGDVDDLLPELPWESLLAEVTAASPEMARAGSNLERARRALRLASAQVVPNITTQAGVGYAADSDDTFAVVGVSVPLPIRDRNQGNIARSRAEIAASHAAMGQTQLELAERLARAAGRYRVARQRVDRLEQSVVPRAEEALELARTAFQAGESNFLELLTVQRTLSETRLSVLDAVEQAAIAAAEIEGLLVTLGS